MEFCHKRGGIGDACGPSCLFTAAHRRGLPLGTLSCPCHFSPSHHGSLSAALKGHSAERKEASWVLRR